MVSSATSYKTFLKALTELHGDFSRVNFYLKDKRLTQLEKKILKGWLLIKNCRHQEIIDSLESVEFDQYESILVNAQRNLILGIANTNMGHSLKAIGYLQKTVKDLKQFNLPEHYFIANYNLFIAAFNHQDKNLMRKTLEGLSKIKVTSERQKISLLQCEFNYSVATGDMEMAEKRMKMLDGKLDKMLVAVAMSYLISKFIFLVKYDLFVQADRVLEQMKNYRLFRYSSNYTFMRSLLGHILENAPVYAYRYDFEDCDLLYFQLKVIKALSESNIEEARQYWCALHELMPHIYREHFQYHGDKSLFSICFEMYKERTQQSTDAVAAENDKPKILILIEILQKSNHPINKEQLFEMIWGTSPRDKSDLNKLVGLVYKAKTRMGYTISYSHGCYSLKDAA